MKNILDKVYFHPFFYLILIIFFITGNFNYFFWFMCLVVIHELGHSFAGILVGMKLIKIELYPYGGCTIMEHNINIDLYKELFMLLMGPLFQIIFIFFASLFVLIPKYVYQYNIFLLLFNLLPIYPLDGGRLLNILLSFFISFYNALRVTLYIGFFVFLFILFLFIFLDFNLVFLLIVISLFFKMYGEMKKSDYYFNKFLLERYLYDIEFSKIKIIDNITSMKRNYKHFFIENRVVITEKEFLKKHFNNCLINRNII